MIKLKQLLFENNRKGILVPRRTGDEREKNRIVTLAKEIHSKVKDGVYDGDLYLDSVPLKTLKDIRLDGLKISGNFTCTRLKLTNLIGSPNFVKFDFYCTHNELITSLEGCTEYVGGNFYCNDNKLTSLEGGPKRVGKDYGCRLNNLTTLVGCPEIINGNFNCTRNKLKTLEGAPKKVYGHFVCSFNELTSFKGGPEEVGQNFICSFNKAKIESLEGFPKFIGGDLYLMGGILNKDLNINESYIRSICKIDGKVYFY